MIGAVKGFITPLVAILHTGAGPNILRADMLPSDWRSLGLIRPEPPRRIQDASGKVSAALATIEIPITVASLNTTVRFVVVSQLAVPMLLGCDFINTHVKTINPKDASVTLSDDSQVPLLSRIQSKHLVNQATVRCSKSVTIAPYTEAVIRVKSPIAGLCTLHPIAREV
jgi:hypothetical protein